MEISKSQNSAYRQQIVQWTLIWSWNCNPKKSIP